MNKIEGNKLIAEFMGLIHIEEEKFLSCDYNPKDIKKLIVDAACRYHESWDWLIPVYQKVDEVEYDLPEDSNLIGDMTHGLVELDIEMAFEATVAFIEWYNENKLR